MSDETFDELGAHVSARGGVSLAPGRAREIGAVCLQLFTKQPGRWADPTLSHEEASAFREARRRHGIRVAGAHDSYLVNLSSPDVTLRDRSLRSFRRELERCCALGLDFLVTHPGHATDGDIASGILRNAEGVASILDSVAGPTRILLELTAGSGTSVGGSFDNLAAILAAIPGTQRRRVGVCFDTCHAYAAGYDLVGGYDRVWKEFGDILGPDRLGLIHMNDSRYPLGSHKDRHEAIGEGTLGVEPFRRIMCDERLRGVPKILETPKGHDPGSADMANLGLLRGLRAARR